MTPPPLPDVEKHKDFLQTRKEPYAIYLAINTNIKVIIIFVLARNIFGNLMI